MFKFLKDKLKKVISGISDKIRKKPEVEEKPEEKRRLLEVSEPAGGSIEERKPAKKRIEEEQLITEEEEAEKEEKKESGKVLETKKSMKDFSAPKTQSVFLAEEVSIEKKGFFAKLKDKLQVKLSDSDFGEFFEQLEITLMENNVAVGVIDVLKGKLKKELVGKPIKKKDFENEIKKALASSLSSLLLEPFDLTERIKHAEKPYILAFFGINGSGKTTTIAKIAHLLQKEKLTCVIAASDTFRAASIEQLEKHASKIGIKMIKHNYGADPAAVAFDAIAHAKANGIDVVLIDTAGRMHTQTNLMHEMEKICRVAKPNLKIFVGEAIVGNDAVEQARAFNNSIGIDAIILTKADVDEKGGASISTSYITGKPILYLGTGQGYDDLEKFNKHRIISSLGLE